jgi:hypothetical protein
MPERGLDKLLGRAGGRICLNQEITRGCPTVPARGDAERTDKLPPRRIGHGKGNAPMRRARRNRLHPIALRPRRNQSWRMLVEAVARQVHSRCPSRSLRDHVAGQTHVAQRRLHQHQRDSAGLPHCPTAAARFVRPRSRCSRTISPRKDRECTARVEPTSDFLKLTP